MKGFFKDLHIHLLAIVIAIFCDCIGTRAFALSKAISFSLFPMLYAMAIGIVMGACKCFSEETMRMASKYTTITVMFLTAKVASGIAPGLYKIYLEGKLGGATAALILQEFGNMGTALLGVPIAVFLFKMSRAAIGCTVSTSREGTIAIIGEIYGLDSDEGLGVMGGYVTGTVLGTIFFALMAQLCAATNLFHPYALGAACGVGSASMMTASLGALREIYPDMAQDIQTYAYTSQALTSGDGMLMNLCLTLPMTNWLYNKCARLRGMEVKAPSKNEE